MSKFKRGILFAIHEIKYESKSRVSDMRKVIVILIALGLLALITSESNLRFCKRIFGTDCDFQKSEIFKRLSEDYYGTQSYWRELALINKNIISTMIGNI